MANQSQGRCRPHRSGPAVQPVRSCPIQEPPVRSCPIQEPPVRRWPHPVSQPEPPLPPEPTLHYIRCALSYQNQLLSEIKTLLQRMEEADRKDQES